MDTPSDPVVAAMSRLVPAGVARGRAGHLSWIEAGSATPPVVLVAGAGEVGLDWAVMFPDLAAR
ncbi:hypothetical protein SAMN05421812_104468 [Asanoa hainanensis]|uniref:Uncharacterized protein n=1 Tax=Asanoa hainanensis TaxID=560556 RepID=A0A239LQS0_9ACTN|nr:hypothetical protein [Asanoa hainanensis]SNT32019.1 hypothetical protein SAMN05421812_104468 [Asanoa hainanensis]